VRRGYRIILIGHAGHDEVIGTMGQAPADTLLVEDLKQAAALQVDPQQPGVILTQTTLSQDDTRDIVELLQRRYPHLELPPNDDICYATQNRQNAVKVMAPKCSTVLVVGAPASSNANRLVEVAASLGARAFLIESATDIRDEWLDGDVGLTAGASTPEGVVQACVDRVLGTGRYRLEEFRLVEERVMFPLPGELLAVAREKGVAIAAGNERAAERAEAEFRVNKH
jgi:4-hydroxy-3-methylbut-2-enyl diphosphate reductase